MSSPKHNLCKSTTAVGTTLVRQEGTNARLHTSAPSHPSAGSQTYVLEASSAQQIVGSVHDQQSEVARAFSTTTSDRFLESQRTASRWYD